MLRMTYGLAVLVGVLFSATVASAEQRRVALLQPDEQLQRAVSLALSPWDLETIPSNAALPQSSQPEAVQAAAKLARQLGVDAVVWITSLDDGSLLWVFDVETGGVTTRRLTEAPPFEGAAAAAVALSIKTVLRASVIAPPEERFGSPRSPPRAKEPHLLDVQLGAGGYWISDGNVDVRVAGAVLLWMPPLPRLGIGVDVAAGPGVTIEDVAYEGRYQEVVIGAKALFRLFDVSGFTGVVGLGGSAHWAMLRGTLSAGATQANVDRLNASIDLDAAFRFALTERIYVGTSLGAMYSPEYRRYLVDGNAVHSPWPLTPYLMGHCGAELF